METLLLPKGFFSRTAGTVARHLVGKTVVCHPGPASVTAVIVEAEAFEDGADAGVIRKGMLYGPGVIFVMSHRGHLYLNVGTEAAGKASCVMVRSILVGKELVKGPGKVSKRLGITLDLDGHLLGEKLELLANDLARPVVLKDANAPRTAKNSSVRHGADPRWVAHQQDIAP